MTSCQVTEYGGLGIFLLIVLALFLAIFLITTQSSSKEELTILRQDLENYPELNYSITKAMEDGKITRGEFNSIENLIPEILYNRLKEETKKNTKVEKENNGKAS